MRPQSLPRMARGWSTLAPVPAAFRIPERSSQVKLVRPASSPQLFVHEGARQALERRLTAAHPGPVMLSITDNRHAIISHRCNAGVLRVRVHHMFLDAPSNVLDALVRYLTDGDRDASALVSLYIESNGARLAPRSRKMPLLTRGAHHDLLGIFDDLNRRYFDGRVHAVITWGKRGAKRDRPRQTIKLGSYSNVERMIRVHPALDRKWVPRYFLAYVVYHEMLHHVIPANRSGAHVRRSLLHPPEFREREKEYRFFERAMTWERRFVRRLLRS